MPTSNMLRGCVRAALSGTLGLLLAGIAAVPAHADSMRSQQWHLDAMKAEEIWKISTGEGVTVAVIDTGVDDSNPDLRGRVLAGKDLASETSGDEHTDYTGHGTGIAGLIAGTGKRDGGSGAYGLAPGAQILPIRLTPSSKSNNQGESWKEFHDTAPVAIRYAVDSGAKVINISLAITQPSEKVANAVKYALSKGSLIFAGVGNDAQNGNALMYPAAAPGVVGVGAIGKDLEKIKVSQYGPQVDLSAPGEDMIHACGGGTGMCKTSGTSDATAIASATAALIWSKHPDWTNNQVLRVMLNTAGGPTSGAERNDYIGYGAVRPRVALTKPGDPGPADEYPLPDLAAAESPEPSAKPSKPADTTEESDQPAAAAPTAADDSGNTVLWIGLGIGAAVLVGAAVAVVAVRSRRRSAAAVALPPYQPPHAYQQHPQPPYPAYGPPPGAPGPNPPHGGPPGQGPTA